VDIEQIIKLFALTSASVAVEAMKQGKAAAGDQWAAMRKQFDGGEAVLRLQVDFLGQGHAHLRAFLVGTWQGQPRAVEVHERTIQCQLDEMSLLASFRWPSDAPAH
jgi:hypothetical protein